MHLHAPVDSYGLGWGVGPLDGLVSSGHVGSDGSFMAVVGIWHAKDLAIAVAANAGTDRAEKACQAASRSIFRMFAWLPGERGRPGGGAGRCSP